MNLCRLTVQKEGPNTGRGFFSCPKPRGEGCSFFKWADDAQNSGKVCKYRYIYTILE